MKSAPKRERRSSHGRSGGRKGIQQLTVKKCHHTCLDVAHRTQNAPLLHRQPGLCWFHVGRRCIPYVRFLLFLTQFFVSFSSEIPKGGFVILFEMK